ncbi:MAG: autotransporter-associated beta strand repeat-containing protein [Planctomycetes bacterium]|nr:autotransporter-associated beta strand repeat-containing protein [Planctomycetota bacterium]
MRLVRWTPFRVIGHKGGSIVQHTHGLLQRRLVAIVSGAAVAVASFANSPATAATSTWRGTTSGAWGTAGNWAGGSPSSADTALFDSTSTANLTTALSANTSILGLRVTSPSGAVSIGSNTLTLGSGGIDMSSAAQNLTISSGVALGAVTAVPFSVATGRTMALATVTRASGQTAKFTTAGTGTISMSGATANSVLSYGVTNGTDFAAANASNNIVGAASVITYTANPAGTSSNASVSGGSGTTWMDVTTSNPTAAPSAFRFSGNYTLGGLRFNQANSNGIDWVVDANSRNFTLGAILVTANVGAFNVQMNDSSGNVWRLGAGAEALIHQYNTSGDLIFNGKITQAAGTGAIVTKDGPGRVILANNSNSWGGVTNIVEGTLQVGNNGTAGVLGSGNVNNNGSLVFRRSDAISVANLISGSGSVTQSGGDLLTLNNASNSFSGGTTITSGTVTYSNSLADFGSAGFTFSGGAFQWKSGDTADLSSRSVTINAGGAKFNPNGNSVTLASAIGNGGAGGLSLVGTGTLNLTAANSFLGASTINGGVLRANNATGSALGSGSATVNSGGTLSGTGSISGLVTIASGGVLAPGNSVGTLTTGSLTLSAGASLVWEFNATPASDLVVVSGANGLTINGGAITLYNENTTNPFSTNGTYNLLQYSGALGGTGVSALSVANQQAGKTYTFGTSGSFVTLSITTTGLVTSWNVDANGFWTTAGNWSAGAPNAAGDTATFGSAITAPRTVTLDADRSIGNIAFDNANAYTIAPAAAQTLTIGDGSANKTLQVTTGSHTISAPLALSSSITADIASGQSLRLAGAISGTGGITKGVSAGTLYLTASNSYTGPTAMNVGTVEFVSGGIGGSSVSFDGGTLRYATGNTQDLSGKTVTINSGGATIDTNGNNVAFASPIGNGGGGGLTKAGAGTLTLGGSIAYTGATTVNAGAIVVAAANSFGAINVAAGSFQVGNGGTTGSLGGSATIALTSGGTLAFNRSDTYGGSFNNTITGTGAVVVSAGSLTFGVARSYSGTTTVQSALLRLDNSTAAGTGGIVLGPSGTLQVGNASTFIGNAVSISGVAATAYVSTLDATGGISSSFTGSADQTLSLVGSTAVNFSAAGTKQFQSFLGTVQVPAGTYLAFRSTNLNNGSDNALFTVDGQLYTRNNGAVALGALSGTGRVYMGTSGASSQTLTYTIGARGTNANFGGVIADGDAATGKIVNVTKVGSGTQTLSGSNTYTGNTTVSAGALAVNGVIGSGNLSVAATAWLMGTGTINGPVTINGTLSPGASPGLLTLKSLSLGSTSTTVMEINGTVQGTTYDSVLVSDASGLTYGGGLQLVFGGTMPDNTTFDLFSFTGSSSGTFSNVTSTGAYGLLTFAKVDGVWTAQAGSQTISFAETTGDVIVVPEPTALVLVGGLVLIWRLRRRPRIG